MSLTGASMELHNALKAAGEAWEEAQTVWKDVACRAFEHDYWEPLTERVRLSLQAMDHLDGVLAKAMRECSEVRE